jgi:archaellin
MRPPYPRLAVLVAATLSTCLTSAALGGIRYVRGDQALPTNQQDGLSWTTAFKSLQAGIDAAVAGDEVRVGFGVYRPTEGTDRNVSFVLKPNVRLRGGFAGSGSNPDERNVFSYSAVLSGNIGDPASSADNSLHVVRANGLTPSTILDGFHIREGTANGTGNDAVGGGILVTSASPTIVRCLLYRNNAQKGGAIGRLSGFSASSPMSIHGSILTDNTAEQGAAIYAQFAPIQLMNSTVADNAGVAAVDLATISVASTFSSSILYRNTGGSTLELSQFRTTSAPLTVVRSCIEGWDNIAPASATTINSDPKFQYTSTFGFREIRHRLRGDSPCIDQGECTVADVADTDDDGNVSESLARTFLDSERSLDDQFFANGSALSNPTTDIGGHELVRLRTILVNHAATGANDGTSWADAYTNLQSALTELADPRTGGPGNIWIAQGTYKPTTGTDVDATFALSANVLLLGGFVGNETIVSQRNWRDHPTILSGELGAPGATGNSRHVVTMGSGTSFLDGCIVRDGNAPSIGGGGILIQPGARATITHCVITANTGSGPGSAIRSQPGAEAIIELGYSVVAGNSASFGGTAGVHIDTCQAFTIDRSLIAGNSSLTGTQSGLRIQGFAGGLAGNVRNTIIADNSATGVHSMSAQIASDGSLFKVDRCAIESFNASLPGATLQGCFATSADGGLVDSRGADGVYGTGDEDYLPLPCGELVDAGSPFISIGEPSFADLNDNGFLDFEMNDFLDQLLLVDLPVPNATIGADVGPVELQGSAVANPDFNANGSVDGADLAALLGAWGDVGNGFDLTGDCLVDAADLAVLLGAWN